MFSGPNYILGSFMPLLTIAVAGGIIVRLPICMYVHTSHSFECDAFKMP